MECRDGIKKRVERRRCGHVSRRYECGDMGDGRSRKRTWGEVEDGQVCARGEKMFTLL